MIGHEKSPAEAGLSCVRSELTWRRTRRGRSAQAFCWRRDGLHALAAIGQVIEVLEASSVPVPWPESNSARRLRRTSLAAAARQPVRRHRDTKSASRIRRWWSGPGVLFLKEAALPDGRDGMRSFVHGSTREQQMKRSTSYSACGPGAR